MALFKGEIVRFGTLNSKDIDWVVYDINEDCMSLISDDILFINRFSGPTEKKIGWDESEIRQYLNNEIANTIFTEKERSFIIKHKSKKSESEIFLPDISVLNLLDPKKVKARLPGKEEYSPYWLSEESFSDRMLYVASDGYVAISGKPYQVKLGVRICVKLKPNAVINEDILQKNISKLFEGTSNTLEMGEYEGKKVSWRILNVNAGKCTLVTEKALYESGMNDEFCGVSWDESLIRKELNENLFNKMFSPEEKEYINVTEAEFCSNPYSEKPTKSISNDRLFLMDEKQCEYMNENAVCKSSKTDEYEPYWLRNPANTLFRYKYVTEKGKIGNYGERVYRELGVRPAMCINRYTSEYYERTYKEIKRYLEEGKKDNAYALLKEMRGYKCGYEDTEDIYLKLLKERISTSERYTTVELGTYVNAKTGISVPLTWYAFPKGNRAILISTEVVEWMPFNKGGRGKNEWKKSEIKKFLNGYFYKESFSEKEKQLIVPTEREEDLSCTDKLFLPSVFETETYLKRHPGLYKGVPGEVLKKVYNIKKAGYLTRSPNPNRWGCIIAVTELGSAWAHKNIEYDGGIRPAMYIKLS